jgi:hypothetical protein
VKHETASAPLVETAKKKADDGPLFDDPDRWTVPNDKPLKIGNVAITSAAIDVVKLQDGTELTRQCLILPMSIKNYSIRPLKFAGWSGETRLCYGPQRGNVERVPSSPGNPFAGSAEPPQIGSEATLNDVLVFEIPEPTKDLDLELDLVPNGQGDTFRFVIPHKRIKKRPANSGFVASKMVVPTAPPAPNSANPPPTFRPPQTGGFMGNMGGPQPTPDDPKARFKARVLADWDAGMAEIQKKTAKMLPKTAEKSRKTRRQSLVDDLAKKHGIAADEVEGIVKERQ